MKKILELTENGSNRKLNVIADNILYFERLSYNDGTIVTVITLTNGNPLHVLESEEIIKEKLSNP